MSVAHREIVEEQGVEAVLLEGVRTNVEPLAPIATTPCGQVQQRVARECTTWPSGSDIEATLAA